jgi:hypothetical protein
MMNTQWSKHVEAYNKSYYKTRICALSWLITKTTKIHQTTRCLILECRIRDSLKILMTIWCSNLVTEQVYSTIIITLEPNIPSIIKFSVVFLCDQLPWKFSVFVYLFLPEKNRQRI